MPGAVSSPSSSATRLRLREKSASATSNAPATQYELDAARNDNRLYAPGDTAIADPPSGGCVTTPLGT